MGFCFLGAGDCGANSTNTSVNETNIINSDTLNMINKNINQFVANTVVSQAGKCAAASDQNQTIDWSGAKVGGDFRIGKIDQNQTSKVNFGCVQVSKFQNEIANGVIDRMSAAMKNEFSAEALNKLAQTAESEASAGFLSTGAQSNSTNNNIFVYNQRNDINKNIQNIMQNELTNNLNLNSLQECVSSVHQKQLQTFHGLQVGGNVNIDELKQQQGLEYMSECVQNQGIVSQVTNKVMKDLGITVENKTATSVTSDVEQISKSKSKASGIFESIGNMISDVVDSIGNIFGSFVWAIVFCVVMLCLCCCLPSILLIVPTMFGSSAGSDGFIEDMPFDFQADFMPEYS